MSRETQLEFERLVSKYYQINSSWLALSAPIFEETGFCTKARMAGSAGEVCFLCGPGSYDLEIFVDTSADGKRWSLAELLESENIRNWLFQNILRLNGRSELVASIEHAFQFIGKALPLDPRFAWVVSAEYGEQPPPDP